MNKQHQFELLPGLKVRVGDVMYRIVLQYQKADTYTLHSPAGSLCASKIVAYIERPFSEDCWVPVATGASYRQPEDMNQPDAPVCMYRTEGDSKGRPVTPRDLAVLRAIDSEGPGGQPSVFDRVTRGALKAAWFNRRRMTAWSRKWERAVTA